MSDARRQRPQRAGDDTVPIAEGLGMEVIAHPHNVGCGGNQETCYMAAPREGADVVVMLHPDGRYDPKLLPAMVEPILDGRAEMTLVVMLRYQLHRTTRLKAAIFLP